MEQFPFVFQYLHILIDFYLLVKYLHFLLHLIRANMYIYLCIHNSSLYSERTLKHFLFKMT